MSSAWLISGVIVLLTLVAMELTASAVHRHIMHGWGWNWHRSHHEPRSGAFERNDLYAVVFALASLIPFVFSRERPLLFWVAVGIVAYGLLYALLHDGIVHRRFPVGPIPRRGYLKRLVQAHRLHHSVRERDGAVSFGFLYAPRVPLLIKRLRANKVVP